MSRNIKNSIAFLGNLIPLWILMKSKNYPPFLPFYHVVSNQKLEHITSYEVRTAQQFEKELDFLLKTFKPVDLETIIGSPQKKQMHLSFDDGLTECYSIIAPILKRKGIPATFFVSPHFVDNKALFHRFKRSILESQQLLEVSDTKYFINEMFLLDAIAEQNGFSFSEYLSTHRPYLTLGEITELQADGFTIGSHSLNHPEFWTLSEEEQYRQVEESMTWVNEFFNPKIKAFSFPFTDDGIKASLFEKLKENHVVDVTFGTAGLKFDQIPFHFQRIPMERKQKWDAQKVVHFEYFYFNLRHLFSANSVKR